MDSEKQFININKNNITEDDKLILKEYLKSKNRKNNKIYKNNLSNTELGNTRKRMFKLLKKKEINKRAENKILKRKSKLENQAIVPYKEIKNSEIINTKNDKYKKINEEMIKKMLTENYPFPLIAYFYGNFFRNKPIRNFNDFLEQWELFIKKNGDKKIKLRTVQNLQVEDEDKSLFQNQQNSQVKKIKKISRTQRLKNGMGKSMKSVSEKAKSGMKKTLKKAKSAAKSARSSVTSVGKKVKRKAKNLAKRSVDTASMLRKKFEKSSLLSKIHDLAKKTDKSIFSLLKKKSDRIILKSLFDKDYKNASKILNKSINLQKTSLYTYNNKKKELTGILKGKFKSLTENKKYEIISNISEKNIELINNYYYSKKIDFARVLNNDYKTLSTQVNEIVVSSISNTKIAIDKLSLVPFAIIIAPFAGLAYAGNVTGAFDGLASAGGLIQEKTSQGLRNITNATIKYIELQRERRYRNTENSPRNGPRYKYTHSDLEMTELEPPSEETINPLHQRVSSTNETNTVKPPAPPSQVNSNEKTNSLNNFFSEEGNLLNLKNTVKPPAPPSQVNSNEEMNSLNNFFSEEGNLLNLKNNVQPPGPLNKINSNEETKRINELFNGEGNLLSQTNTVQQIDSNVVNPFNRTNIPLDSNMYNPFNNTSNEKPFNKVIKELKEKQANRRNQKSVSRRQTRLEHNGENINKQNMGKTINLLNHRKQFLQDTLSKLNQNQNKNKYNKISNQIKRIENRKLGIKSGGGKRKKKSLKNIIKKMPKKYKVKL